ncbi:hypothetical protein [Hydrogenophaga defluvii]|uniref:Uncharacterized protein n=1 Tax=Hydrogenophaga defluvii TaxID=249410 RepID=A0ABW2SD96_9BURK
MIAPKMLKIFNYAKETGFAKSAAADIAKRFPPELASKPGAHQSASRLSRIIEDVCEQAVEFKNNHKMGWFRKSKLCNTFRWELVERGYKKEFVDFATEALLVYLSRETKRNKV